MSKNTKQTCTNNLKEKKDISRYPGRKSRIQCQMLTLFKMVKVFLGKDNIKRANEI